MQEIVRLIISYLSGIWRYRWVIVLVPALVSPVGWFYVATLPDKFEAAARVYVDTDSVLNPLMQGLAVRVDDQRRINMMTKLLFSRQVMEKLARMTDQDLKAQTPQQMDALIQELKNKVKLRRQAGNIYRLGYADESRELAKRVVQSFLTIFVETNLGESRKDQDSAEQFLLREAKEYERRLIDAERRMKEFKGRNLAYLSGRGDYFGQLQDNKTKLEAFKLELQMAEERRNELDLQLADLKADGVEYLQDGYGAVEVDPLQVRINAIEGQIADLLLRYTARHPEVVAARRTVDRLKGELAAAEQAREGAVDEPVNPDQALANNPVYQQMKLLLTEAEADVASRQTIVREYQRRIEQLQQEVDRGLEVETEQKQLDRNYSIVKKKHDGLMNRLESLRLGRQVDSSAETVRFRVIEPPKVPEDPVGPNRMLLSSIVFGGSLFVGLVLALVISLFRPFFSDRKSLNEATGITVLGSVDMIWTDHEKRKRRRYNLAYTASLLLLLGCFGAVIAIYQLDIDVLSRLPRI